MRHHPHPFTRDTSSNPWLRSMLDWLSDLLVSSYHTYEPNPGVRSDLVPSHNIDHLQPPTFSTSWSTMMRVVTFTATTLLMLLQAQSIVGFQTFSRSRQSATVLHVRPEGLAHHTSTSPVLSIDRKSFLVGLGSALTISTGFPAASQAKSYSENAANLERINSGDFSGQYVSLRQVPG